MEKKLILFQIFILFLVLFSRVTRAQDTVPPSVIGDLKVYRTYIPSSNKLILEWTAPGDDGDVGKAAEYDIRYATFPINEDNWDLAVKVNVSILPKEAGSRERFVVSGLSNNTNYYFAIKARDESNNWSGLSNVANRSTVPAIKAKSGSAKDIQGAVDAIASTPEGMGVVYIPEGNFSFDINITTNIGVTIPGGISIIGAGINRTILYMSEKTAPDTTGKRRAIMFYVDGSNGKPVRISGISFKGYVNYSKTCRENSDCDNYPDEPEWGATGGVVISNGRHFRIDNCSFKDFTNAAISISSLSYGVIDHCSIDNPYKDYPTVASTNSTGRKVWGYGIIVGGTGAWPKIEDVLGKYDGKNVVVYIEDCNFSRTRHLSLLLITVGHGMLSVIVSSLNQDPNILV
jgi:hypothetical protein